MTTISQQTLILESQSQLRNADKLARDWAIAHAGSYQGQARKELAGNLPFRKWERDNLVICLSKPQSPLIKQCQVVSVRYRPSAGASPYTGYLVTYLPVEGARQPGCLIAALDQPDALEADRLPWDDNAGSSGLDALIASLAATHARPRSAPSDLPVAAVADLFDHHNWAIALTEYGQQDAAFRELAAAHSDWANIVNISAAGQLALCRELPERQLAGWVRAKLAAFCRYPDRENSRLRMMETDLAKATDFLAETGEQTVRDLASRSSLTLLELLESTTSAMLSVPMLDEARALAEALVETAQADPPKTGAPDNPAIQQRVYVLEDQLDEANDTIAELRERLAQYENYANPQPSPNPDDADPDDADLPETAASREIIVLDALTDPGRFPRLRFLTNCAKPLADFGKTRPYGREIVAALDAVNKLAQAWYNTPGGSIGNWDNYFTHLKPGWTHANSESDFTMSRFGDKRSFSDQEKARRVTITRHLTYRGSNSGLQIYFDRDDLTNNFIVGYIGEHLPYATNRS